jgi:hypothetical protein
MLVMIYPIVTQMSAKAHKDYNYWGIFSILLILLLKHAGLMALCIEFVDIVEQVDIWPNWGSCDRFKQALIWQDCDKKAIKVAKVFGGAMLGCVIFQV